MDKIEENGYLKNIFSATRGKDYDVLVMYSGGKDSSFLLYVLKEVYHLRVAAAIVDNGFENEYMWEPVKRFANNMKVPLHIIRPEKKYFLQLFKMLVTEHELFARKGINHICFICNNILWTSVAEYAAQEGIPFVVSGLSRAQLSSGRPNQLEPNAIANQIAEKSSKMVLRNAVAAMQQSHIYNENQDFRMFMERMSQAPKKVTTVYPYIYHTCSTAYMKEELTKLGWVPPRDISVDEYISSGCRIMSKVVRELEKVGMVTLNEREQARWMVEQNLAEEKDLLFAQYDAARECVDLREPLLKELEIKEYLKAFCEKEGHEYIEDSPEAVKI